MPSKTFASAILIVVVTNCIHHIEAIDEVCFGHLGCFSMAAPWNSLSRPVPLPQSPDKVDTTFHLYTRNSTESETVRKLPEVSLESSTYNGEKETFFITHGFLADDIAWLHEMKDALLKHVDGNVFVVKWEKGASNLNYLEVAANTRIVGAEISRVIEYLLQHKQANQSKFHLIGHSLGAHIMSYVAKRIPNIARLTALDPAQPGFEGFPEQVRLDRSDAKFVEVIHTNAKPFFPLLGAGMMAASGHVDFYINGGWDQPGCFIPKNIPSVRSLSDLAILPVEVLASVVRCPHERSIYVFIQSILHGECMFWGRRVNTFSITASVLSGGNFNWLFFRESCSENSCSPLGLETINYPARGSFLLPTSWSEPYCISEPENDKVMAPYRKLQNASENVLEDDDQGELL